MKTKVIAVLLGLGMMIVPSTMMAQYNFDRYYSNYKGWEEGDVDLNLFRGVKPSPDSAKVVVKGELARNELYVKKGSVSYKYNKVNAYIDYDFCRIAPELIGDTYAKMYAQTVMNIYEKYARIATKEYACEPGAYYFHTEKFISGRMDHHTKELAESLFEYGDTAEIKRRYDLSVSDLQDIKFDPEECVRSFKEMGGVDYYVGLCSNVPVSDALSWGIGLNTGFDGYFDYGFFINGDVQIGTCADTKAALSTEGGSFAKGEELNFASASIRFGARVINGSRLKVYPFAGFGVLGFTSPHDHGDTFDKNGVMFSVGMNLDYALTKKYILEPSAFYGQRCQYNIVRLTPSVSITNLRGIGKVTSFNVALSYDRKVLKLRKKN